jgi:hypothetical protein
MEKLNLTGLVNGTEAYLISMYANIEYWNLSKTVTSVAECHKA